ncbi:hypothetical protein [Camelimonas lactis]|uniref:Uncharacterized protein n=1 Tax=Camelimonas lactis TaxID=659006 RepID=A0A4R2GI42_9HYPH|nr:hypothetical protein [Camelimonas lactis]TCO07523.1 hypothetical protein EV666_1324 [Camelimonas lactis]
MSPENGFSIDDQNRLYWKGAPVKTENRLVLTVGQVTVAIIVTGAAFFQGAQAFLSIGCSFGLWTIGCSK